MGKRRKKRRKLLWFLALPLSGLLGGVTLSYQGRGEGLHLKRSKEHKPQPASGAFVHVLSLNLAHGRGGSFHQLFLSQARIKKNLKRIAKLLRKQRPQIVALQEIDGPSFWSAPLEQGEYLAREAGFSASARGHHVQTLRLDYGTALLSRLPLKEARSFTFPASPPTFSKGFVLANLEHSGSRTGRLDVVSLHLDFARSAVRRAQIDHLIEVLRDRSDPLIIMGDFNATWEDQGLLPQLCKALKLHTWKPEAPGLITFPAFKRRIDWILASTELEFVEHQIFDEALSDHRALSARLRFR